MRPATTLGAMSIVRTTWLHYTQALSVELMYRFSLLQGFIGVLVSLVGLIYFWVAAGRSPNTVSTYMPATLVAYFVTASAFVILQENRISWNLSMAIRMGKLAASMLRPYPYLWSVVAQAGAYATMRLVFLVPIAVGVFYLTGVFQSAGVAFDPAHLAVFFLAMLMALAIGWMIKIAVGLLAFDMTQTWGPELVFLSFFSFASGAAYPPDLLPERLHQIVTWTPPYYMIGFPSLILIGRVSGPELVEGFLRGGIVMAACFALIVWMWRRGVSKFEAIGI